MATKTAAVVSRSKSVGVQASENLRDELGFIPHVWTTNQLPMGELLGKYDKVGTVYICDDVEGVGFDTWRVWATVSVGINFIE